MKKLLEMGCLLLLVMVAVSSGDPDSSSLAPAQQDEEKRSWHDEKTLSASGDLEVAAASPEEDLVYGDDILPLRTRPRNKRRRRKRIRPQRPLDYDDLGDGSVTPYRPRLRPRLRARPLFDPEAAGDQFPDAPIEERRPRPGGRRRKPLSPFPDSAIDMDVAAKPGPPFTDIDEDVVYANPRRRPALYPRKPTRILDDEHEELPYRVKAHHLLEDDQEPRPRKGPRRPLPLEDPSLTEEQTTRRSGQKHPNKFNPGEEIFEEDFKQPSRQKALKFDETFTTTPKKETVGEIQDDQKQKENLKQDENLPTEEYKDFSTTVKSPSPSMINSYETTTPTPSPAIIQEQQPKQTKPYLPRFNNDKPYSPETGTPTDMKPITLSFEELLKMKNITLHEILRDSDEPNTSTVTKQTLGWTSQGPLRRLPSASEFFAKRKNSPQNSRKYENKSVGTKEINQVTEETLQIVNRPREGRRKYGNNNIKQLEGRISIKEVLPTTTTTTTIQTTVPELETTTPTTSTPRKQMPLNMQESPVIDPLNDEQLASQDLELAKQNLKNRINEANNGSKVQEFLQSNGIRLPPITAVIPPVKSVVQEVTEEYNKGQVFVVELGQEDRPVQKKIPLDTDDRANSKPRDEILDLLQTESGSARLARILATRNMSLAELIEHRERGASHQHLSNIFPQENRDATPITTDLPPSTTSTMTTTTLPSTIPPRDDFNKQRIPLQERPNLFSNAEDLFQLFRKVQEQDYLPAANTENKEGPKIPDLISIMNPLIYNVHPTKPLTERVPRVFGNDEPNHLKLFPPVHQPPYQSLDYDKASTIRVFPPTINKGSDGLVIVDDIGQVHKVENNGVGFNYDTTAVDGSEAHQSNEQLTDEEFERSSNLLPTAVKSAIIASTAIFGLAIIVFLAIFIMCKWRQKRARQRLANETMNTRAKSPILDETLHHDARHSKCSLSPVLMHRGHNYGRQNIEGYIEPRRYYLWRTIRNTLRYK